MQEPDSQLIKKVDDLQATITELTDKAIQFSEISLEGIIILEGQNIRDINVAGSKILGYADNELIGKNANDLINFGDFRQYSASDSPVNANRYEVSVNTKNGQLIYCEAIARYIDYKGAAARVIIFRDITDRRKAELLARESEERFRRLSEASFEGILIHLDGVIVDFNETLCSMLGYSPDELRGKSAFDLAVTEDRLILEDRVQSGKEGSYETKGVKKDGTTFYAELNVKKCFMNGGIARIVAIRDISDRKMFEKKLQQVNFDYENLINNSPDGIFILNEKGEILFANPGAHRIIGILSPGEITGKSIFEFATPGHHRRIKEMVILLRDGYEIPFVKTELIRIDGSPIEIEYKPVKINYQGKNAILVVYHDMEFQVQLSREKKRFKISEETNQRLKKEIEERKKIEKKLSASKELYKGQSAKLYSIIESSSHLVWTVNREMALTTANENFLKYIENLCGVKPAAKSILNRGKFISTRENNEYWNKIYAEVFSGNSRHFETTSKTKKGLSAWWEFFLNPIFDSNGNVTEVSGIGNDITEKKLAEEKIKQSLKEKEVLLKEVHHRVKNNLQVISSILNLQSSYLKDKKTINLLKESQTRIKAMSFIHESLYQTKDFTSVNFSEYVENISSNLLLSFKPKGKKIKLHNKIDTIFLNLDIAIPCGLIINELMSNALKYAFADKSSGEIVIRINTEDNENFKLVVSDNGSGLPKGFNYRNTQTLGLQLVMILVNQLKGSVRVESKNGTKFLITFNKNIST